MKKKVVVLLALLVVLLTCAFAWYKGWTANTTLVDPVTKEEVFKVTLTAKFYVLDDFIRVDKAFYTKKQLKSGYWVTNVITPKTTEELTNGNAYVLYIGELKHKGQSYRPRQYVICSISAYAENSWFSTNYSGCSQRSSLAMGRLTR